MLLLSNLIVEVHLVSLNCSSSRVPVGNLTLVGLRVLARRDLVVYRG
jgi:hypothetical protein